MSGMLCKLERFQPYWLLPCSWKEINRYTGKIPFVRRHAKQDAREMSAKDTDATFIVTTWNEELKEWVSPQFFRNGYEVDTLF